MIHLKDRENLLPKIGTVLKFLVSSSGFMKFKNLWHGFDQFFQTLFNRMKIHQTYTI